MAHDRYVRGLLTVIAVTLVYLAVILTPWPSASAQTQPPLVRPGDNTGPIPVAVVAWRAGEVVPVSVGSQVLPVAVQNTVQVDGRVTTERSAGAADRVILVGWEERADPAQPGKAFRPFDATTPLPGLPTTAVPR